MNNPSPTDCWRLTARQRLWILLPIIGAGSFFRLFQLAQLPPGDGYDPAFYGVDALQILAGARPIYLVTNFGREVLFSYWVTLIYLVTGSGTFGLHLAAAFIGVLTLPAVYFAAHELLVPLGSPWRNAAALLAALVLALSYWHLNWSRVGVRAIWVPLVASLVLGLFLHGWRTRRPWAFVGSGLALGLSLYTYQVARLLPVLLALGAWYWWRSQPASQRPWRQAGLLVGPALLVMLPLFRYAWQHPGALSERVWQVAVVQPGEAPANLLPQLGGQAVRALQMFSFVGDDNPMYTIPQRPSLNPFLSLFFYLGIGIALRHWRNPRFQLLLAWLGVMLLPALLADSAAEAKRAIGTLPAVVMLIALGMVTAWQWLEAQTRNRLGHHPWLLPLLLGSGLAYTAVVTYRDYFIVWAQDPGLFAHFESQRGAIGAYIARLEGESPVFVSGVNPAHPSVQLHSRLRPNVVGYDGRRCLIVPDPTSAPATYVIAPETNETSLARLAAIFPQGKVVAQLPLPHSQWLAYVAYQVPGGQTPHLAPQQATAVNWNNEIELLGYDLAPTEVAAGETLTLTLYYRALQDLNTDYTVFVHLLGENNPMMGTPLWAQVDNQPCGGALPTSAWRAGQVIQDTLVLTIPADAPPSVGSTPVYTLNLGFYHWPDLTRLSLVPGTNQPGGDHVVLHRLLLAGHKPES